MVGWEKSERVSDENVEEHFAILSHFQLERTQICLLSKW